MSKSVKVILGIVLIVILSGGIYWGYSANLNRRVEESKERTADLSRAVSPIEMKKDNPQLNEEVEDMSQMNTSKSDLQNTSDEQIELDSQPIDKISAQIVLATTQFRGEPNYPTSGQVKVIQEGDFVFIQFGDDFSFGGAPDPVVYLTPNAGQRTTQNALILGQLTSDNGQQAYQVSLDEFNQYSGSVMIWCEAFSVFMAGADL